MSGPIGPPAERMSAAAGGLSAAVRTHTGRVRRHNEDSWVLDPRRGLFAAIDGMGGSNAGEVAADLLRRALEETGRPHAGLRAGHQRIRDDAARNAARAGMGCVATAALVSGPVVRLAHVGDTRAWLVRDGGCEQLTRDHTVVAARQEAEALTEQQAEAQGGRHQVTRDIGTRAGGIDDWIDLAEASFGKGDLLVLCTDGLSDMVPGGEVVKLLTDARRRGDAPDVLVERLVDLALQRGGKDNVTVLAVRRTRAAGGGGRGRRLLTLAAVGGLAGFAASRLLPGPAATTPDDDDSAPPSAPAPAEPDDDDSVRTIPEPQPSPDEEPPP